MLVNIDYPHENAILKCNYIGTCVTTYTNVNIDAHLDEKIGLSNQFRTRNIDSYVYYMFDTTMAIKV